MKTKLLLCLGLSPLLAFGQYVGVFSPKAASGQYFAQNSASIYHLNDRLFLGGASAADGKFPQVANDWLSTYLNANGYTNATLLGDLVVETGTNASDASGIVGASRSLNFTAAGTSVLGVTAYAINNNATYNNHAWAFYGEAHKVNATVGPVYGMELDTRTLVASATPTPYTQGDVVGLQLASGAGVATGPTQFDASSAMQIQSNPKKWKAGIVFGATSIVGTDGVTGVGTAIAFAKGHVIQWYNSSGIGTSNIYGNGSSQSASMSLSFSDSGATFTDYLGNGSLIIASTGAAIADYVTYTGGASASSNVTFAAGGTDSNISLTLTPKGTGGVLAGTYFAGHMTTLTYASPTVVTVSTGNVFKVTTVNATGSVTFNADSGGVAGQEITLIIPNDATSGKTITFGTNFKPKTTTIVGTTSTTSTIKFVSDGTNLYELTRTINIP